MKTKPYRLIAEARLEFDHQYDELLIHSIPKADRYRAEIEKDFEQSWQSQMALATSPAIPFALIVQPERNAIELLISKPKMKLSSLPFVIAGQKTLFIGSNELFEVFLSRRPDGDPWTDLLPRHCK